MTSWPALDVAIGLSFTFGLLALVCTSVNEAIATVFNLRAKTLQRWIATVISDPSKLDRLAATVTDLAGKAGLTPEVAQTIAGILADTSQTVDEVKDRVRAELQRVPITDQKLVDRIGDVFDPAIAPSRAELHHNAKAFYSHPAIRPLVKQPKWVLSGKGARKRKGRRPSYVPASAFATFLLHDAAGGDPTAMNAHDLVERLPEAVRTAVVAAGQVPSAALAEIAQSGLTAARADLVEVRTRIEKWFDDSMDRVSGWYKRRVQLILAVLAVFLAVVLNADTIRIAGTLWSDTTLRNTIVATAGHASSATSTPSGVRDELEKVNELNLPIGWTATVTRKDAKGTPVTSSEWRWPSGGTAWASKVAGILITAFALMLGAPFWFDWLGKFVQIRSSGDKPAPEGKKKVAGAT